MSQKSSSSSSSGRGFTGLLTIVFIVLKLIGKITWSWYWVLSPIWISVLLILFVLFILFFNITYFKMKISILHASRSRSTLAESASRKFIDGLSRVVDYEYILSLDYSDPDLHLYPNPGKYSFGFNVIVNDNQNLVQAANHAANAATGDILILLSDDFLPCEDWDIKIVEALHGKSGVLKTYDGIQKWIVTLPIMTRDYYDEQGYLYDPDTSHMFCDTIMTHKADLQKKLIIRNDIVFKHNHYSTKGGQPKDEVNKKADLTWAQGEKVYLDRCRNKFGLGNVNIYDLSPEASKAGHVNWLKKKLR